MSSAAGGSSGSSCWRPMDTTAAAQRLLQPAEQLLSSVEVRLEGQRPGQLALVQRGGQRALFALTPGPALHTALPITGDFACDIDTNGREARDSSLRIHLRSGANRLTVVLSQGAITNSFIEQVMSSSEAAAPAGGDDWDWALRRPRGVDPASVAADGMATLSTEPNGSEMMRASEVDSWLRRRLPAPGAPLVNRERLVLGEMRSKEDLYTDVQNLSVLCATWNVNGQSPSPREPVQDWLASSPHPPDIYAIGFQELDLSKEAFLFPESPKEEEWLTAVLNNLHPGAAYQRVRLVRLVGMMLVVLVQDRLWAYVRNVAAESVGTGIMGKMGNKGGVAVRMEVHCTSMCFVSSHLAAHVEEYERRNQDYADICHRLRFNALLSPKSIKDHDQVFWLGDLNYRITDTDVERVKELVDRGAYEEVLKSDQLRLQLQHGRAFQGFQEGQVTFRPTYKYDPGTDTWDSSEKGRAPAWCDRVLWRGRRIALQNYTSHPSLQLSDHKPVSALFQAGVKVIDPVKQRAVYEETMKELDKFENDGLPQVTVDTTEILFGEVHFYESKTQTLTITNTGRVTANFSFINKLNEVTYCRPWLSVEPACALISAGERCEVTFEVRVDDRTASRLNTCQEKLYDILVLHLENGKDIFITVQGDYVRSCFGVSLNALVHIKTPFNMVSVSRLLDLESPHPKDLTHNPYVIPKELWFLVDQLQREGLGRELFLQSGLPAEVAAIREALDTSLPESLPGSVHSVAEALQLLLASLPEPVIPAKYAAQCLESSNNFTQSKQIVVGMSPHHKNVFTYICSFLRDVVEKAPPDSCLEATTLAKIFGAVMIRNPASSSLSLEQLDRRKTTFVYHFLVNEIDI